MGKEIFIPILKKQLGKTPKGNLKVIKLCKYGFPQLIENDPLLEGKPFPNLFWLTCPYLVKQISKLESKGFIELFEERLKKDEAFRRRYLYAHQFEAMLRKSKLPPNVEPKIKAILIRLGVGGIKNPLGVKCLHLHLASFWGGVPNPIGESLLEFLPALECSENLCSGK